MHSTMDDPRLERRKGSGGDPGARPCPWCGGRLELQLSYPRRQLIPGALQAIAEEKVPEGLRTTTAWVCATPHCRFRESA